MTRVSEIMTRGVLSIAPDASIEELARGLTELGLEGAPVRDAEGRVYGVVSKTDLVDPQRPHAEGTRVADVMSPVVVAVRTSDSALHAAERMLDTGTHRLLVVDLEDHAVGIVTPMDVLRAFVKGRLDAS